MPDLMDRHSDWEPSSNAKGDQLAAYDRMREQCPVAYADSIGWSLFRHADIINVLSDHVTFSSQVSAHVAIPNGMDPPLHTRYRQLIDPYFHPSRVAQFEPACRAAAVDLVRSAMQRGFIECIGDLAEPYAVAAQCIFMGWPPHARTQILDWQRRNTAAIQQQDRAALTALAAEFEALVSMLLDEEGRGEPEDTTAMLRRDRIDGRALTNGEIAGILRNWTAGEIGTISAAIGIVLEYLAAHDEWQSRLRGMPHLIDTTVDEILRARGPLVMNRRVTTRPVVLRDRTIGTGEHVNVLWIAGNRDPRVFDEPDTVRPDRDPGLNLLYGAGIHACPGAPLARMELRVLLEALFDLTTAVRTDPGRGREPAAPPAVGWGAVFLHLR